MSNGVAEAALDQKVVDGMFAEITSFIQAPSDDPRAATMLEACKYVEKLFDTYAPDIDSERKDWSVQLGGAALGFVRDRYGFNEYSPKVFSGLKEQDIIATFHHAGHSRGVVLDMFRYAVAVNRRKPGTYQDTDFMMFPIIGGFHDTIMGNGRGNDERQSGKLANRYLTALGYIATPDPRIQIATDASAWDEKAMKQSFDPSKGYAKTQRAMCVGDHMSTLDRRGPYIAITLAPEDFSRNFNDRIFTKEARTACFSLAGATIETCLEFIDSRDVLRKKYGAFLGRAADFFRTFQPADPALEDMFLMSRADNVAFMRDIQNGYAQGRLAAVDTLTMSRAYMLG